ncbi:MAG: site-specific DNA-methyltransferase, partial [Phycisphaerae bacterium]
LLDELRGRIDLIYIDPPFNLGADVTMAVAAGARGAVEVPAYRDRWGRGADSYEQMMFERLMLMRELLSPTGSIYVHCDRRVNAALRLILDEVFGPDRLCNEIIWHYQSGGRGRGRFSMKHDTLFWYARGDRWTFNLEAIGQARGAARRNHMRRQVGADGRTGFSIKSAGKVYTYYEDDLLTPADVWTDISHIQQKDPQRCGYPTQKPEALLERIIRACSNEGDLVADFFCGSGTTGVVAERLGRRWLLCDQSPPAVLAALKRLIQFRHDRGDSGAEVRAFEVYSTGDAGADAGGELFAEAIRAEAGRFAVRLTGYKPNPAGWPSEARRRIRRRTASKQLDLIDYWAVDFDWRPDRPFHHSWQAVRDRGRGELVMESAPARAGKGRASGFICVKALDPLGRESRAVIPRPDSRSTDGSTRRTTTA